MLNPWQTKMDPFQELNAEAVFRESMNLNRQDSLDDALQLIYRDHSNGQNLNVPPSPPAQPLFGDNDLNFEGSLGDVGDYQNYHDLPNAMIINDLDQGQDFKKNELDFSDFAPAVCSPLETPSAQEQAVPVPNTAELDDQQPTHYLFPGQRTPLPLNRGIKTEPAAKTSISYLSSSRPTRPQSVAVRRIKEEVDMESRDSATPDSIYSADGSRQLALPKPRKYERKPEPVKSTLSYQEKRAKNNDAVRRSRAKAKSRQGEVEDRVAQLESENHRLHAELKRKDSEIRVLKSAMESMSPAKRRRQC